MSRMSSTGRFAAVFSKRKHLVYELLFSKCYTAYLIDKPPLRVELFGILCVVPFFSICDYNKGVLNAGSYLDSQRTGAGEFG